jgi:hypothetical protein
MAVCWPMRPDGFVVVDDDFAQVLAGHWSRGWSIRRANDGQQRPILVIPNGTRWGQRVRLARLITQSPPHLFPQHRNGDVLDCRKANLRLVGSRGRAGGDKGLSSVHLVRPRELILDGLEVQQCDHHCRFSVAPGCGLPLQNTKPPAS